MSLPKKNVSNKPHKFKCVRTQVIEFFFPPYSWKLISWLFYYQLVQCLYSSQMEWTLHKFRPCTKSHSWFLKFANLC